MIDSTILLLSISGAMAIIICTLWIFKLPPFMKVTLGEQDNE